MSTKPERDFNTEEVTAAVKIHLAACLMNDVSKELGRVFTRQQREGIAKRSKGLHELYEKTVSLAGDSDKQAMVRNRAASLTVQVGYARTAPERKFLVDQGDMEILCGHLLNYCDLECPCVVEDEDGSREVIRPAVKGCEIRKLFKRLGLVEGFSAECPYSMYIGDKSKV